MTVAGISSSSGILAELARLRSRDAPTHGGHVLAYVYDSGVAELDRLAGAAAEQARPLNGLDPMTFPSIAAMERDIVAFVRDALHGPKGGLFAEPVVGSVTSGGTESCLLAVKTARDLWRKEHPELAAQLAREGGRPRLVTSVAVHAAFQKAAQLFDLDWDPVPCEVGGAAGRDGSVDASRMIERLAPDVALVVVSAPAYPTGMIDPIPEVSAAARKHGISCHVDACFGGLALPWWPGLEPWDFRLPGVTSISADLHKYGYAPKGVSVLLHRSRARHRAQFFATRTWPGYPVVNPTLLGSKSASPLAAAWAIIKKLGTAGYADLTASCARSVAALTESVHTIRGLAVLGTPAGPALTLIADRDVPLAEQVDPHRFADEVARHGFRIQHQPGLSQGNGTRLPHSAHLTITPVTERSLDDLVTALSTAADAVRGIPAADAKFEYAALRTLGYAPRTAGGAYRVPTPRAASLMLRAAGVGASNASGPGDMATLMALIERLPAEVANALLIELVARLSEDARQ